MRYSTNRVFVDTGAFIALLNDDDKYHREALWIYTYLLDEGYLLYTTNHIVDETCSWLLRDRDCGHGAAIRFGEMIRSVSVPATAGDEPAWIGDRKAILIYSTPEVEGSAWDILAHYRSTGFSFTDCTSFAVMRILSIRKVFAFDVHFDIMGFERIQA